MKRLIFPCCSLVLTIDAACAQSYSIDWYKVAGGGGTSSNGQYAISGTIGQHDAGGPFTGGNFSHTGGFWSLVAVQTPGSPLLTIARTSSSTVTVSWPLSATIFALQQNTNLGTTNWTTPAEMVTNNGTNNFIIVNLPAGNRYFRLVGP
jgi:hypothetical protein